MGRRVVTANVSRRIGALPPMTDDPLAACAPGRISPAVRLSFFPDAKAPFVVGRNSNAAKAVCCSCPLVIECGRWALRSREPHGVWGAMDAGDRKRMLNPSKEPG